MDAIILSLLLWINQNTNLDYDLHQGTPTIQQAAQMTLAALIIDDQDKMDRDMQTASFQSFVYQLEAAYDHKRQTILINSKTDLHSPYGRSVIVHELVHFVQYQQGENERAACLNALEKDAYEIQARFMEAHHIPKNFDKVTIALRSLCWNFDE